MTQNQNEIYVITKKTIKNPTNSWTFVIQHLDYQKTCTPIGQRITNSKMCSFVADWELPKLK